MSLAKMKKVKEGTDMAFSNSND